MRPFVKWVGGKTQLLGLLRENIPDFTGTYFEPFVGGGALLFALQPERAVVNDINPQLINTYRWIAQSPGELIETIERLDSTKVDKELYLRRREQFNRKIAVNALDLEAASLFIWLNKHCFNGLYRVNRKGLFNAPVGSLKEIKSIDPQNIRDVSAYLANHVSILNQDYLGVCEAARPGDFVFLDPPYVPVSATANFTSYSQDGFTLSDHENVSELCRQLDDRGVKFLATNNDTPLVRELYSGFTVTSARVFRAVNVDASRRKGSQEVIITNYRQCDVGDLFSM